MQLITSFIKIKSKCTYLLIFKYNKPYWCKIFNFQKENHISHRMCINKQHINYLIPILFIQTNKSNIKKKTLQNLWLNTKWLLLKKTTTNSYKTLYNTIIQHTEIGLDRYTHSCRIFIKQQKKNRNKIAKAHDQNRAHKTQLIDII